MAAVLHSARHLRQGIGVSRLNGPAKSTVTQCIFSETRTFLTRLATHLVTPGLGTVSAQPALIRPSQQSISSRFSLPVKHALARPFSPPRLPRPPVVPTNVTQVGLGTARAFHSGRPIFQNMVDNVPIATRALWEAEWDLKMKKKETRRMRRASQNKTVSKSHEMLKPSAMAELDVYFPVQPTPPVTTHLLVPLAPTPTARLPLSTRTDHADVHPLLPITGLASIHTSHRLHSLRVSTLFARLDAANVWDDPGVNVDAYAFGPRHDAREKQCTILRVTFRGWDVPRVGSILGDSGEKWYSLQETHLDGYPTLDPLPGPRQGMRAQTYSRSPLLRSVEIDSNSTSEVGTDDTRDVLSPPPTRACASAQHDLVLPTLDFSSAFSNVVDNLPHPQQPVMFLSTVSELAPHVEQVSQSSSVPTDSEASWECLGLNSPF